MAESSCPAKGLYYQSLTKLKQICDHPVLADSSRFKDHAKVEASGKMERLAGIG